MLPHEYLPHSDRPRPRRQVLLAFGRDRNRNCKKPQGLVVAIIATVTVRIHGSTRCVRRTRVSSESKHQMRLMRIVLLFCRLSAYSNYDASHDVCNTKSCCHFGWGFPAENGPPFSAGGPSGNEIRKWRPEKWQFSGLVYTIAKQDLISENVHFLFRIRYCKRWLKTRKALR